MFSFKGKSQFGFHDNSHSLSESSLDHQRAPNSLGSPTMGDSGSQLGLDRIECYSRKVFVGGLPPDIDEGSLYSSLGNWWIFSLVAYVIHGGNGIGVVGGENGGGIVVTHVGGRLMESLG